MTLLELLVKTFDKWPDGIECLSQLQKDGSIINGRGFDGRVFDRLAIASDTPPAGVIVTKVQWEAAVKSIYEQENWHRKFHPPVGTLVECTFAVEAHATWHDGIVIGNGTSPEGEPMVVINCDGVLAAYRTNDHIRPRRDERQKAVDEMWATYWKPDITAKEGLGLLYDAGYRKQEAQ